jgi:hypothetical protein
MRARLARTSIQKPDHRHRGLLRARRERPRRCAAEQRDEVATPEASCHLIPPARRVMPPNDSKIDKLVERWGSRCSR